MKSHLGTTFDSMELDMSTERINGGAGVQNPGWSVRFRHVRQKKSINNNPARERPLPNRNLLGIVPKVLPAALGRAH